METIGLLTSVLTSAHRTAHLGASAVALEQRMGATKNAGVASPNMGVSRWVVVAAAAVARARADSAPRHSRRCARCLLPTGPQYEARGRRERCRAAHPPEGAR